MDQSQPPEWDEAKRKLNFATHGVDFNQALELDWEFALTIDQVRDGELRHLTYAPIDERLYALVWVERQGRLRVISFRKANPREQESYEEVWKDD